MKSGVPEPRRYKAVLAEDLLHLSKVRLPAGAKDFDNLYFSVALVYGDYHAALCCKRAYAWDECSVVWNFIWAKFASCFHDAGYQFAEALASTWGCTVREVLRWADEVFLERMLQDADSPSARRWAYVYYFGVRIFGYRYHQLARIWRRIKGRPLGIIKQ
jgi:hypothetical protein